MRCAASWRFALAVLVSLVIALMHGGAALLWWVAIGGVGCVHAVWVRDTTARAVLMRLGAVNAFVLLLWLTLSWRWSSDGLALAPEGLQLSVRLSLRANAIALACTALLAGIDATTIAQAVSGLGLPDRLVHLSLLMVRYLDLFKAAQARRARAARARGFTPHADRRTLALLGQQTGLLLVQALDRAEGVERAMRARGFTGAYRAPPPAALGAEPAVPDRVWRYAAAVAIGLVGAIWLNRCA